MNFHLLVLRDYNADSDRSITTLLTTSFSMCVPTHHCFLWQSFPMQIIPSSGKIDGVQEQADVDPQRIQFR